MFFEPGCMNRRHKTRNEWYLGLVVLVSFTDSYSKNVLSP